MPFDVILLVSLILTMAIAVYFLADDYLDPLVLMTAFYGLMFVLRPAMLLFDLDYPVLDHLFRMDHKIIVREAVGDFLLGYIAFALAYASRGLSVRALVSGMRAVAPPGLISVRRLGLVALIMLALSTVVIGVLVVQEGGVLSYLTRARNGLFDGRHILQKLPRVTGFICALWASVALLRRRGMAMAFLAFGVSMALILLSGDRSVPLFAVMNIVVVYHVCERRIKPWTFATVLACVAATVILLGELRIGLHRIEDPTIAMVVRGMDEATAERTLPQRISRGLNLQSFDYWLVVRQDIDRSSYRHGEDFLLGIIGVVPRAVWSGKPEVINPGGWFSRRYTDKDGGQPFTAPGVWWVNFGLPGVIFGMALSGLLMKALYSYMRSMPRNPFAVTLYAMVFFNMTSLGIITSTWPSQFVFWAIPLLLLYRFTVLSTEGPVPEASPRAGGRFAPAPA